MAYKGCAGSWILSRFTPVFKEMAIPKLLLGSFILLLILIYKVEVVAPIMFTDSLKNFFLHINLQML